MDQFKSVMSQRSILRVVIPHFFREGANVKYASGQVGNRFRRQLAFARCLGSVLSLNRSTQDLTVNHADHVLEPVPPVARASSLNLFVELHLFVSGDDYLTEVVHEFRHRLQLHRLQLSDPRDLPLASVRWLLEQSADHSFALILEDDLVVSDPAFVHKQVWFTYSSDHRYILMPHRYEICDVNAPLRLFVDGPIRDDCSPYKVCVAGDEAVIFRGQFKGNGHLEFVEASNPHSGSLFLTPPQLQRLKQQKWPPNTFVSPLETATAGVVLPYFPILKPHWEHRDFCSIEHANPTYLPYLQKLSVRRRPVQ